MWAGVSLGGVGFRVSVHHSGTQAFGYTSLTFGLPSRAESWWHCRARRVSRMCHFPQPGLWGGRSSMPARHTVAVCAGWPPALGIWVVSLWYFVTIIAPPLGVRVLILQL